MAGESNAPDDSEFVELPTVFAPEGDEDDAVAADDAGDAADADADDKGGDDPDASKDGDEGEDGEKEGDEDPLREKRGRSKGGAEARIGELTRLRYDAERRAAAALAEVARLKGTASPDGAKPGTAAKPTPDQFEDYGEYVEALTDWKVANTTADRATTEATRAHEEAASARSAEWQAKVAATAATIPEWDDVVGKSDLQIAPHVAAVIMETDPRVMMHLAQNPDVAERLNEMSPARAAVELGKIEATLGEPVAPPPAPRAKTVTTAPAPITPVQPGSTTAKDPSKMNMDEYKAYRAKQGIR